MSDFCVKCGKVLCSNELGASRKFINRATTEYYCFTHISERLGVSEEKLQQKITEYKNMGCTLFV